MQLQIIFCTTFYTTLHPAVVVEVTTAPIPKNTTPTTDGPSMDSLCHPGVATTHLLLSRPIFETSATALRGTIGHGNGNGNSNSNSNNNRK
jgi:hypothetical protein